jgi:hypothetical protein
MNGRAVRSEAELIASEQNQEVVQLCPHFRARSWLVRPVTTTEPTHSRQRRLPGLSGRYLSYREDPFTEMSMGKRGMLYFACIAALAWAGCGHDSKGA